MTDEELIARLRERRMSWVGAGTDPDPDCAAAADRIEALVKERDEALEWLSASQGYIADAVFALDKQEKAEARAERLEAALEKMKAEQCAACRAYREIEVRAALTTEDRHE